MAVAVADRPVLAPVAAAPAVPPAPPARLAPPASAVPPAPPAPPAPPRARVRLRDRLAAVFAVPDDAEREHRRLVQLAEARAMLERAHATISAGWVQDAFYVVRDQRGELRPVSPFGLLMLSRRDVAGACLVGAVAHASSTVDKRDRRGPAATAVDSLWAELAERHPDAVTGPGVLPGWDDSHPGARAARVRDLARWNDDPRRSKDEVLSLLAGAVSRTVPAAAR